MAACAPRDDLPFALYGPLPPHVAGGERRRRPAERLLDAAAHFVLPAWCAGCGERLPWRPSALGLCVRCREALPRPPACRCAGCGSAAAPGPGQWLCTGCSRSPPACDGLHAAWSYRPPIDEVVRRLKYGRLEFLAEDLAAGIAAAVAAAGEEHDLVTPVPLHWRRRLERGYDQAALLGVVVARRLALPYRPVLVRRRATPPQAARTAALRRTNVAGAFRCRARRRAAVEGARVLLVDDVATTGATLESASRALKAAGAARVTAAVAALTPPRGG
ncbi:MAG TPA: phosphoribosyltransferase family protein [Thermoanaerobaculia bacterium]|nr:phosphoribosyltransferase family protein [Thermoanaerobaculia bacterium]